MPDIVQTEGPHWKVQWKQTKLGFSFWFFPCQPKTVLTTIFSVSRVFSFLFIYFESTFRRSSPSMNPASCWVWRRLLICACICVFKGRMKCRNANFIWSCESQWQMAPQGACNTGVSKRDNEHIKGGPSLCAANSCQERCDETRPVAPWRANKTWDLWFILCLK